MKAFLRSFVLMLVYSAASADCAKFGPASTHLVGRLVARQYPGPPNYESVAAGDAAERLWILELRSPLCVDADPASVLNTAAVPGVTEVQLVATGDAKRLARLVGKEIEVSGTLFAAHTGHHKTPVLLQLDLGRPEAAMARPGDR